MRDRIASLLALVLFTTSALAEPIQGHATVIDGDTIEIRGHAVAYRLYGTDYFDAEARARQAGRGM